MIGEIEIRYENGEMNENLELYKEFYFREIDRKYHLNNAVNIPILVITAIISIHFFIFEQNLSSDILIFGKIIGSINFLSILISLYFLIKSFSNLISTHIYREIANMGEYRKYEINLIKEQEKISDAKFLFNEHLIKEFSQSAQHNFNVNKIRTEDLAISKITLFVSVILTIILFTTYIITII